MSFRTVEESAGTLGRISDESEKKHTLQMCIEMCKWWKIADGANIAEDGRKSEDRLHRRGGEVGGLCWSSPPAPLIGRKQEVSE